MLSIAVLTAALFSTSAFAAPAIEARSEIICTGQPTLLAHLTIFPDSAVHSVAPATGDPLGTDPVRDATANPLLQRYNGNGLESFIFYSCESTYMNYTSVNDLSDGVTQYYGQVRLSGNSGDTNSCLTVAPEDTSLISLRDCSATDDVSQTTQFWRVTQNITSLDPAPLRFIGNITNDGGHPRAAFYSTGYGYLGGNPVATSIYHVGLNPVTDYSIKMVHFE